VIDVKFSNESSIVELQKLRIHPHPCVRVKALILILKSQKIPHHKIARIANVSENTVRQCFKAYQQGGIKRLETLNFRKPQSRLQPFEDQVKNYFKETPPSTINEACAEIGKITGIFLKNTQMRAYIKSIGLRHRKVSSIPAKADIEAQKKFHDEKLQPRLEQAQKRERDVYFIDAAHFVLGAFLGYLWSFARVFVRTPSGRQRFNVLGALNAITKELVMITNDTYITSVQVCELLRALAQKSTRPITLVLDNARYQRCNLVTTLAAQLKIELLFLPPYSPNLNLIERLWKLVKKECLYNIYYENFALFRGSIQKFLSTMNQTHQQKLNSLLMLNFQTFTEEQFKQAA
jgi:transposase